MTKQPWSMRMARPGRDVSVTLPLQRVLKACDAALATEGFAARSASAHGFWWDRGRTGLGVMIAAVSEALPLCLVPGSRRHMDPYRVRLSVLSETVDGCSVRLDVDRRSGTAFNDAHFETVLGRVHEALEAAGGRPAWGDLTDSAAP
ncbi:hypothetical protein [Demequina globuliformis]|uniref:hypothetical protein n=1 Tax=Demequina globuliformis TaxID=676202 RepID=UPI00128BDC7B|nr:hypothetical protein [Demequina globuliformis]